MINRQYKIMLTSTREAERQHDEKMTVIAARGGKTLKELRNMGWKDKDEFIMKYREEN